jgi:hypothetical protein
MYGQDTNALRISLAIGKYEFIGWTGLENIARRAGRVRCPIKDWMVRERQENGPHDKTKLGRFLSNLHVIQVGKAYVHNQTGF